MSLILLQQLYAMRAQLDATILHVEAEQLAAPVPAAGCLHPAEKQVDGSTMGGPSTILCMACGQERLGVLQP